MPMTPEKAKRFARFLRRVSRRPVHPTPRIHGRPRGRK